MLFGAHHSTRTVFVGLGTAALLVTGVALPALAADPSPSADPSTGPSEPPPSSPPPSTPSPPPTTPPAQLPPALSIKLSLSDATAAPGGSVTAVIQVSALHSIAHNTVLRLSASSANVSSPGGLGDLGSDARSISAIVTIPPGHAKGTVTVTASVSADRASSRTATRKLEVTSAGSASGGITPGGMPNLPSLGIPGIAPQPGSTTDPQLPLIGQDPAVAPLFLQTRAPVSLRANSSPLGLDETSYRLVWTDVAWLTSLLVGLSLLITQLRLNRHRQALTTPRKPRPTA